MPHFPSRRTCVLVGASLTAVVLFAFASGCTNSDSPNAPLASREVPHQASSSITSAPPPTTADLVTYEQPKTSSDMRSVTVLVSARSGGSLEAGDARLDIPKGALAADTPITLSMSSSSAAEYQIEPTGLKFLVPATLTLDYKDTSADPSSSNYESTDGPVTSIAWFDPSASVWTNIGGTDDKDHKWVCLSLSHLSYYALSK